QGGGARYPYPKYVWSPAGGWWVRPSNWAANTAFASAGIAAIIYATWNYSSDHETFHTQPDRWIPSMLWSKEYRNKDK
ncbi:hypothetical protein DFP72DRAFT_776450, partial [Ephemerocybe angulata]